MAPGALVCLCCWRGPRSLPRLVLQRRTSPVPLYLPLGSHRAPRLGTARPGRVGAGRLPAGWDAREPGDRLPSPGAAGGQGGLQRGAAPRPGLRAPRGTLARFCSPVPNAAPCSRLPLKHANLGILGWYAPGSPKVCRSPRKRNLLKRKKVKISVLLRDHAG